MTATTASDGKPVDRYLSPHRPLARRGIGAAGAMLLAVTLTLAPLQASSALAFNQSNCPSTNLDNWDTIRVDAGKVDLGDVFHLPVDFSNNAPHGDAIVCWYKNKRKVFFQGRLWNDRLNGEVRAVVTAYRGTGASPILVTTNVFAHTPVVLGNGGNTPDKVIDYTATVTTDDLYRLRVSLEVRPTGKGTWTVVSVHNRYWGF